MQKIHNFLEQHSETYAKYHQHPNRSTHHFAIFIAVAVLVTATSLMGIKSLALSYDEITAYQSDKALTTTARSAQNLSELTTQLLQALKKYQKASGAGKQQALNALIDAAQARRNLMLASIKSNPQGFLLSALPGSLTKKFPAEATNLLEQEKEVTGKVTIRHFDLLDKGDDWYEYGVEESATQKKYKIDFAQGAPHDPYLKSGDYIKVKGVALENNLVAATGEDLVSTTVSAQITAGPTGEQRVLAMLINFTANPTAQPWTPAQIADQLFTNTKSTNAYYHESSFNLTNFSGDVTNWITVPYDGSSCSTMDDIWANSADQLAAAAGFVLSNYNRKIYIMAGSQGCPYAGSSYVGGNPSRTWTLSQPTASNNILLFDHELGHAIGMWHASTLSCGSKAIDAYANCTVSDYGDTYDTMGSWNSHQSNGAHKAQQTYFPTANVKSITASSGSYTIYSAETASTNTQALKIYKPDSKNYYYVSYRQAFGFDSDLPAGVTSGASIVVWPINKNNTSSGGYSNNNTGLLDTTPGDGFTNSSLADGRSFQDVLNGITITQISHDSNAVTVQVNYGPAICVKAKPAVSISPLSKTGSAGTLLTYIMTVINNDSPACSNSTFSTSAANLPAGFTFTGSSVSVAPGSNANVSLNVTSPLGFLDSSNTFTASAQDTTDAAHSNSVSATYVVFTDLTAPVVSITSPVNGSVLGKSSSATISVTSTDNVSVSKVEIYVDNTLKATDASLPYSYKWNIRNVTAGTHTITAKAYDLAGNVGSASITVTK